MIPARLDITVPRGGSFQYDIRIKDALAQYTNFTTDYLDKGGAGLGEIRLYVRQPWKLDPQRAIKETPLLKMSTTTGEILVVTDTILRLSLTAAVTAALAFSKGQYDLELCTGETPEWVDKPLWGYFLINDEFTN